MIDLTTAIYGTCCGVGYLAICAFLAVVMLFLFVSIVGAVSDAFASTGHGGGRRQTGLAVQAR